MTTPRVDATTLARAKKALEEGEFMDAEESEAFIRSILDDAKSVDATTTF